VTAAELHTQSLLQLIQLTGTRTEIIPKAGQLRSNTRRFVTRFYFFSNNNNKKSAIITKAPSAY